MQYFPAGHALLAVVTMHPVVGSAAHVAKTLPARQTVPPVDEVASGQSGGGGKHVQAAPPLLPEHCLPAPHELGWVATRHPLSIEQVTMLLASLQKVPVIPLQMAGGVGHVQTPFTQGLLAGQLEVPEMFKQPSLSRLQVAIWVGD